MGLLCSAPCSPQAPSRGTSARPSLTLGEPWAKDEAHMAKQKWHEMRSFKSHETVLHWEVWVEAERGCPRSVSLSPGGGDETLRAQRPSARKSAEPALPQSELRVPRRGGRRQLTLLTSEGPLTLGMGPLYRAPVVCQVLWEEGTREQETRPSLLPSADNKWLRR